MREIKLDTLPDELILKIFHYLDKRDLCHCSRVNRKWNVLTYTDSLWLKFSLNDLIKPKWCASRILDIAHTNYLIENRFSANITRVDLAKMFFSFDTLDTLFQHCQHIKSLVINFKYLQIKVPNKYLVDQCIHSWPINKLEKLYLKNVCDMKARRFTNKSLPSTSSSHHSHIMPYDIIEMEIIKLIRTLFERNSLSLRSLGLKCVDPNIISSCINDFGNLEVLLLNNVNDTDSVLQELAFVCKNLKCLELNKCREFQGDGLQDIIDQCINLETLQLGKQIFPTLTEFNEINWSNLKYKLKELSITTKFPSVDEGGRYYNVMSSSSSSSSPPTNPSEVYSNTLFNYLNECNQLEYLALADFTLKFPYDSHRNPEINNDTTIDENTSGKHSKKSAKTETLNLNGLKYLYLRNIRNVKILSMYQSSTLKSFLETQQNLHTLDLTGLYLNSSFICSILTFLNNLR